SVFVNRAPIKRCSLKLVADPFHAMPRLVWSWVRLHNKVEVTRNAAVCVDGAWRIRVTCALTPGNCSRSVLAYGCRRAGLVLVSRGITGVVDVANDLVQSESCLLEGVQQLRVVMIALHCGEQHFEGNAANNQENRQGDHKLKQRKCTGSRVRMLYSSRLHCCTTIASSVTAGTNPGPFSCRTPTINRFPLFADPSTVVTTAQRTSYVTAKGSLGSA